jgi:hypothetical protein
VLAIAIADCHTNYVRGGHKEARYNNNPRKTSYAFVSYLISILPVDEIELLAV